MTKWAPKTSLLSIIIIFFLLLSDYYTRIWISDAGEKKKNSINSRIWFNDLILLEIYWQQELNILWPNDVQ